MSTVILVIVVAILLIIYGFILAKDKKNKEKKFKQYLEQMQISPEMKERIDQVNELMKDAGPEEKGRALGLVIGEELSKEIIKASKIKL